jgi:hypothetical protein
MSDAENEDVSLADAVKDDIGRHGNASNTDAVLGSQPITFGSVGQTLAALDELVHKTGGRFGFAGGDLVTDPANIPCRKRAQTDRLQA